MVAQVATPPTMKRDERQDSGTTSIPIETATKALDSRLSRLDDGRFDSLSATSGVRPRTNLATAANPSNRVSRRVTTNEFRVSGLSTWTGRVVAVEDEVFTAELIPDQNTPGIPVLADFLMTDVDSGREVLSEGDVVYVTVRNVRPHAGALPHKTTSVRLRRLGKWTAEDATEIANKARELKARLDQIMA